MRVLWLATAATLLASCGSYQESNSDRGRNRLQQFDTLSFAAVTELVFKDSCYSCHSDANNATKGRGVNLETFSEVTKWGDQIVSDLQSDKMPKGGAAVASDLKQIVYAWVQNKMPLTSNIPITTKPTPPPAVIPGWDMVRDKVLGPQCTRCHGVLNDVDKVRANIEKIRSSIASDRMPKGSKALKPEMKKIVEDWAKAGMPMGFEELKQKLFIPYCVRCHGGFANYDRVSASALHIWTEVWSDEMPINGDPVPLEVKQLLDQWIKQGKPN